MQVLTNIIGNTELAAYATTREDAALRDAVIDRGIPYWDAVKLIGKFFPGGVKKIVEDSMRERRGAVESVENEDEDIQGAIAPMLTLIQDAYMRNQLEKV